MTNDQLAEMMWEGKPGNDLPQEQDAPAVQAAIPQEPTAPSVVVPTSEPAAEKQPEDQSQEQQANDYVPENIKAIRNQPERQMWSPQKTFGESITVEDFIVPPDASPEQQEQIAAAVPEFREIFEDVGLEPDEARSLVTLARKLTTNPPTPEQIKQSREYLVRDLLEVANGDEKAVLEDLNLAWKLANRDPRVARLLEVTRLGNSPRVIKMFIQKAKQERSKGRL